MAKAPLKCAYAHLITNTNYLVALLVVHQCHVNLKSKHDFVVLMGPDHTQETRDLLSSKGMILKDVEYIRRPGKDGSANDPRFADGWTKFRAWDMHEYDRVVIRDIDVLIRNDMDDIFETDLPPEWIGAAHPCTCNPRRFDHYPKDWIRPDCAHSPLKRPEGIAQPTQIKPGCPRPHTLLNAGMILLTPSKKTLQELIDYFMNFKDLSTLGFLEQDMLPLIFEGRFKPLPYTFNALRTHRTVHKRLWSDEHVKVIHYIFKEKPWTEPRPAPRAAGEPSGDPGLEVDDSTDIQPLPPPEVLDVQLAKDTDELFRWWWDAFDELEAKNKHEPWWPKVEANVIGKPGARY